MTLTALSRKADVRHKAKKNYDILFVLLAGGIIAVAGVLRFVRIWDKPGFEWDEAVYASVGTNEATRGVVEAKTEYYEATEPYLYHPPFYFELLGQWFEWFGAGVVQARVLAAIGSLLTLVLLAFFLKRFMGYWSLLVVGLLSIDAWMVFTNRVSWIENTMMPLGIIALIVYRQALQRADKQGERVGLHFAAAGVLFGAVAAYKHVGVFFFLAALITWAFLRVHNKRHLMMVHAFTYTVAAYVIGMFTVYGDDFKRQVIVQFRRSLDLRESRGALDTFGDFIGPLTSQYAIFWVSVVLVSVALGLVVYRLVKMFREFPWADRDHVLVFSWALAALIFFGALQLRLPHYFMMIQVPLYTYLVLELKLFLQNRRASPNVKVATAFVAAVILVMNLVAMNVRFIVSDDDALRATAEWTAANLPANVTVVTEESVGTIIDQPYCKIGKARYCQDSDYIITYESQTQQVPDSRSVEGLLARASPVASFSGFKEKITIHKID